MRVILLYILLCFSYTVRGQNLVPNGSFEEYHSLNYTGVSAGDPIELYINNWFSSCGTPELLNEDFPPNNTMNFTPPNTIRGFQYPHTGTSFVGFTTYYSYWNQNNLREYIGIRLYNQLIENVRYHFEYFINYTSWPNTTDYYPIKNVGIFFSSDSIVYPATNAASYVPDSFPTINVYENSFIVTDSVSWIKISGSFIANGNEQYLYFGNFKSDTLTQFENGFTNPNGYSYYFIDDVLLIEDTTTSINETPTSPITIYPNPAQEFISVELPQGVGSAQLSIYTITGQLVYEAPLPIPIAIGTLPQGGGTLNNTTIDLSHLSKGMFVFVVRDGDRVWRELVVKE